MNGNGFVAPQSLFGDAQMIVRLAVHGLPRTRLRERQCTFPDARLHGTLVKRSRYASGQTSAVAQDGPW
jgi:hypothetical protein